MKRFISIIVLLLANAAWALDATPTISNYESMLTPEVRRASESAWHLSRCGLLETERVVLVVAIPNDPAGAVEARALPATFEERRFTFRWQQGTLAVLHTHPNDTPPAPSEIDIRMAEQFHVPVFTITSKGLYVYDPYYRQTVRLASGTGWMSQVTPPAANASPGRP